MFGSGRSQLGDLSGRVIALTGGSPSGKLLVRGDDGDSIIYQGTGADDLYLPASGDQARDFVQKIYSDYPLTVTGWSRQARISSTTMLSTGCPSKAREVNHPRSLRRVLRHRHGLTDTAGTMAGALSNPVQQS